MRHQMLTCLTSQGLQDSQIQLISGHASKKPGSVPTPVSSPSGGWLSKGRETFGNLTMPPVHATTAPDGPSPSLLTHLDRFRIADDPGGIGLGIAVGSLVARQFDAEQPSSAWRETELRGRTSIK
jgi:hypothetical protein